MLEPSGIYSLDLALALDSAKRIEVMMANPSRVAAFARATTKRGKTDAMDACVLLQFVQVMAFQPWTRPSDAVLQLRQLTRYAEAMVRQRTRALNKRHAAEATTTTPKAIIDDLNVEIASLEARIAKVRAAARALILADPVLASRFRLLVTIPGIAETSAAAIVSELAVMADDMTVRQWVAHAGLDPRPKQSGTSVRGQTRISKHGNAYLRKALYMPALVASRCEPHVEAYVTKLVEHGKRKLQAVVAVMRKLLHAIYGMLKHGTPWDGAKFYAVPQEST